MVRKLHSISLCSILRAAAEAEIGKKLNRSLGKIILALDLC